MLTLSLSQKPSCNLFKNLSRDRVEEVRETIIVSVLATDMKNHVHLLSNLQAAIELKKHDNTWFDVKSRDDRLLCCETALHCSDLSNPAKPQQLAVVWTELIMEEFFRQGDRERKLHLKVSPMKDRFKSNIAKCQLGFINFVVEPLLQLFAILVPRVQICLKDIESNRKYWKNKVDACSPKQKKSFKQFPISSNVNTKQNTTQKKQEIQKKKNSLVVSPVVVVTEDNKSVN